MSKRKPNGLLADLIRAASCAECGERMRYDERTKEWLCLNLHAPEPDEEVYQEVCEAVERANKQRQASGLRPLSAAMLLEGMQEPLWDGAAMPWLGGLFRGAVQVDEICGGLAAADRAMKEYVRRKTQEEFRADYAEFLREHCGPAAGYWPWESLARAAAIADAMGAQVVLSKAWDDCCLPKLVADVTAEQVDQLAGGLLLVEAEAEGVLF